MRRSPIDLGLFFVVLVWGLSPTLFTIALGTLQPLAFAGVRFLLLSMVSVAVLTIRGLLGGSAWRIARRDIWPLIISGLSGYGIYQLFYIIGLAHTTPFASALLSAIVPIFSAIILAIMHIERIHPVQWLGIGISFVGLVTFLVLAGTHGSAHAEVGNHVLTGQDLVLGDVLTIIGVALFSVYGIVNKRLAPRYSPPELMCYTLLIGTIAMLPFCLPALISTHWTQVPVNIWLIIAYSVIFPIYLTYSIWNWAIGKRGVGYVTLYSYLTPIFAGAVAWVILGQGLTSGQIIAAAVVLGGMILARWGIARINARAAAALASVANVLPAEENVQLPAGNAE